MPSTKPPPPKPAEGHEMCTMDENGNASNIDFCEAFLEGVDDSEQRKHAYEKAKAAGVCEEGLKLYR